MRMSMSSDASAGADAYGAANAEADVERGAARETTGHGPPQVLARDAEVLASLRQDCLAEVAVATEDMLATLERVATSDGARDLATHKLQESLEARAQALLEIQLRNVLAGLHAQDSRAAALSNSQHSLPSWALDAVVDLAQRADVEASRQRLKEVLCIAGNGIRQSVANATETELSDLRLQIEGGEGANDRAAPGTEVHFDRLVEEVRHRYAPAGAGATAYGSGTRRAVGQADGMAGVGGSALRSAAAIETDVRRLVASLAPTLSDAMQILGLDAKAHEAEGERALREAAIILVDHGLNTPEQVRAFLDQVNRHDERLAFLTGVLAQVGYPLGMAAFLWGVAPQLAPSLLGSAAGVQGAVAFGALAGAMIGWTDSAAGSAASAVYRVLAYGGSGSSVSPLAQHLQLPEARDLRVRAGTSAAATFTKNALLRAVIPSVVYGLAFPAGVNRAIRDHVDFAGDAGGGFLSGGIAALLTRRRVDSRPSQDFKLLTQANLPAMIQRAQQGDPWRQTLGPSVAAFGRGLGVGALAPSTWAVTGLVMTPLVALLMGINLGLVPKLGWSEGLGARGAGAGNDAASGHAGNGTMAAGASEDMIAAAEHALRATVSTLLMAVLAGGATGVGNWVGRRADADGLAAVFGAVRAAAERLRAAMAPGEGREVVALTGLRRRSATASEGKRY